ncbi:MAG: DUF4835 family protein [FCB group bacterium]|nr:DUF4835 family protein [FCB group bacterium]
MRIQQSFRIIIGFLFLLQVGYSQYGKVTVTFDDRLLKGNDRQILQSLKTEIEHFFTNTVWDDDYSDLAIPLQIQIIFDGISVKGGTRTYLAQTLFSAGADQRYFDKAVQFIYNDGTSLYYDPVIFDPLASFLAFYANLILAAEIDTYEPQGGTTLYETSRSIALRGKASDYPRGWSDRIQLVNDLSINYGLRKARFAYYYGMDLFKQGQVEEAIKQFQAMMAGLEEVYDRSPREHYTVLFLKAHAEELTSVLKILRQTKMLENLIGLDPDNEAIYARGL